MHFHGYVLHTETQTYTNLTLATENAVAIDTQLPEFCLLRSWIPIVIQYTHTQNFLCVVWLRTQ